MIIIMMFPLIVAIVSISVLILFAFLFIVFEFYVLVIGHLKGAPYVPSSRDKVTTMITLAELKEHERVVDLGSGGGALVFAAAKKGVHATGVECNPFLVLFSRARARWQGLSHLVSIEKKDFRDYSLVNTDVVFIYLWPSTVAELREKFLRELKSGSRVVSHAFPIKEWRAEKIQNGVYRYIIGQHET